MTFPGTCPLEGTANAGPAVSYLACLILNRTGCHTVLSGLSRLLVVLLAVKLLPQIAQVA